MPCCAGDQKDDPAAAAGDLEGGVSFGVIEVWRSAFQ